MKAVHFVSHGLTPPYKGWREKSNAMLSWCPTEGALPPGGNESRGGLLPVDLCVWEALDFKAKLPDFTAVQGECMESEVRGILYRDPGTCSSGRRIKIPALTYVFLRGFSDQKDSYKSSRDVAMLPLMKSDLLEIMMFSSWLFWDNQIMDIKVTVGFVLYHESWYAILVAQMNTTKRLSKSDFCQNEILRMVAENHSRI